MQNPISPGPHDAATSRTSWVERGRSWAVLIVSLIASLLLFRLAIINCGRGYEFTDEGYYLNWISHPWDYSSSVTQFGFVYHPLYAFLNGDIALLRSANTSILFLIAWLLSATLLDTASERRKIDWQSRAAIWLLGAVVAVASLAFLDLWLPTPSYNSLNLQACMLTATGVVMASRYSNACRVTGWALLGLSGGLAFLAKPPTAAMLGLMVGAYFAWVRGFQARGLAIACSLFVLLLGLAAFAIDRSIGGFAQRIVQGLHLGETLAAGHDVSSLLRSDSLHLSRHQKAAAGAFFLLSLAFGALANSRLGRGKLIADSSAIVLSLIAILAAVGGVSVKITYEPNWPIVLLATSVGTSIGAMWRLPRSSLRELREAAPLALFLLGIPFAFALGTNNNLWTVASHAALFWLLAGLFLPISAGRDWSSITPAASAVAVALFLIIHLAVTTPYRQLAPLSQQSRVVQFPSGAQLRLDEQSATYIVDLQKLASMSGYQPRMPVLDLTGVSPGALYAFEARPLALAWISGGYPGSNDLLAAALGLESCEVIGRSWILADPGGPDSLSPGVLRNVGIEIERDYLIAGNVSWTRGFAPSHVHQYLLKPKRSPEAAQADCERARQARAD